MKIELKVIDPSTDSRWDKFCLKHSHSTIYHHSLWKELIQESYGYQPLYFVLEKRRELQAGIPFFLIKSKITGIRMVSLPFSDYCAPLINNDEEFATLFREVIHKSNALKVSYIELKTKNTSEPLNGFMFEKEANNRNHTLELMGCIEEVRNKFHHSCIIRNIKKALKSEVTIIQGGTEKDMRTFYQLHVLTRKRHGLPPQPYKFFKNMWELLYPKKMLHVLLAIYNSKPIAGIVISKYKDTMYYLYGGSDSKFHLNRPNHLLLWEAIQIAHREGFRYFDFGRTALNNRGLLDFKRRWGTQEYEITSYIYSEQKGNKLLINRNGIKSDRIQKLAQKMPASVLRFGGKLIYKHLG